MGFRSSELVFYIQRAKTLPVHLAVFDRAANCALPTSVSAKCRCRRVWDREISASIPRLDHDAGTGPHDNSVLSISLCLARLRVDNPAIPEKRRIADKGPGMSPAARQLKQEQAERKATESITARVREFETHLCRELRSTDSRILLRGRKSEGGLQKSVALTLTARDRWPQRRRSSPQTLR